MASPNSRHDKSKQRNSTKHSIVLNNKGMEMWQIILIILALVLLLFMLAWSGQLGTKMESTLSGFGNMF